MNNPRITVDRRVAYAIETMRRDLIKKKKRYVSTSEASRALFRNMRR